MGGLFADFDLEPTSAVASEKAVDPSNVPDPDDNLVPIEEAQEPWVRQEGETHRAFHAFCHYRDLPVRSTRVAYHNHKRDCENVKTDETRQAPKGWHLWSSKWGWYARSSAWDNELDRQTREKLASDQVEARLRHARMAQGTLQAMIAPVRAVLEAMKNPEFMQRMILQANKGDLPVHKMLTLVTRTAHAIAPVVAVERQALGLAAQSVEVDDRRKDEHGIAEQIATDSESTNLAIALLDRLSHAGEGPASGPGDVWRAMGGGRQHRT